MTVPESEQVRGRPPDRDRAVPSGPGGPESRALHEAAGV